MDNSPIFYSIKSRNLDALEILCDTYGTQELNFFVDSNGYNPLTLAASLQNWEVVNYLSIRGILLDIEDRDGKTVLMKALWGENFELASKLINRGANIDAVNREGRTALTYAVTEKRFSIVEFLLRNGANPHIEDLSGKDCCDYAKEFGLTNFDELRYC
jgi:ankyrin repeat protein